MKVDEVYKDSLDKFKTLFKRYQSDTTPKYGPLSRPKP